MEPGSFLTKQIIDSTPDHELLDRVQDHLLAKMQIENDNEYQTVMSWPTAAQAIFILFVLEGEVNGIGFREFFAAESNQYTDFAVDMLELIGSPNLAAVTEKAIGIYKNNPAAATAKGNNLFDELDKQFLILYNQENLVQLQVNFIRRNKESFIAIK